MSSKPFPIRDLTRHRKTSGPCNAFVIDFSASFLFTLLCLLFSLPATAINLQQAPSTGIASAPDPLAEARALLAARRFKESETLLRTFLASHPTSPDAHFLLGTVLFHQQKATDSLAEFTAGAKIKRPTAEELKTVASDYVLLSDFTDADKWFTAVTVETPKDGNAWYLLGRTQYHESKFDDAIASFEQALKLSPQYVEAENNLGLAWRDLEYPDKAKAAFQTAIDWQGPTPTDAQPFLNLGAILVEEANVDKAIEYLSKAVTISPNNPKIHEELGAAYDAREDYSKARVELEQAVSLAPESAGVHFKLGQVYRKLSLKDLAKREFDICAKLNSTHSSKETPNPYLPNEAAPK